MLNIRKENRIFVSINIARVATKLQPSIKQSLSCDFPAYN